MTTKHKLVLYYMTKQSTLINMSPGQPVAVLTCRISSLLGDRFPQTLSEGLQVKIYQKTQNINLPLLTDAMSAEPASGLITPNTTKNHDQLKWPGLSVEASAQAKSLRREEMTLVPKLQQKMFQKSVLSMLAPPDDGSQKRSRVARFTIQSVDVWMGWLGPPVLAVSCRWSTRTAGLDILDDLGVLDSGHLSATCASGEARTANPLKLHCATLPMLVPFGGDVTTARTKINLVPYTSGLVPISMTFLLVMGQDSKAMGYTNNTFDVTLKQIVYSVVGDLRGNVQKTL
uniref:Uncharacterized protein n=1 Tax=Timema genevievae TaxID=629358 RepID=A0A7R9JV10_TIMGE|nr:unnamed protein product [Timema genevievae]